MTDIIFKRGSLGEASVFYAPTASHSVPVWENGVSSKIVDLSRLEGFAD